MCCSPWGHKESDTTEWLNWTELWIKLWFKQYAELKFSSRSCEVPGPLLPLPHSDQRTEVFFFWWWSQVALACKSLEQDLASQPEIDAGSQQWKHQILATRPMVSDKALALQLCRKEFPQRWKVLKQVKYLLWGKRVQYLWIDTWADSEGESLSCWAATLC